MMSYDLRKGKVRMSWDGEMGVEMVGLVHGHEVEDEVYQE